MLAVNVEAIPAPRNRAENRIYRRECLIQSAIATVGRYDLAGATVERICHGAGASRGLIAHYFASKEDLLITAAREIYDHRAMEVKWAILDDPDLAPGETIKAMARSSFEAPIYSEETIAAWQAFTNASRSQQAYMDIIRRVATHLRELYEPAFAAAASELNRSIDCGNAAVGLVNLVEGLWNSLATGRDGLAPGVAAKITEQYIAGCLGGSDGP